MAFDSGSCTRRSCDVLGEFGQWRYTAEHGYFHRGTWFAVNADECLLTRMQEMSLDYHFKVEQEVGSSTYAFFGFNGTAWVWRISALNEAGGWKDCTTVEDMDLGVRASLKGWNFVYIGGLKASTKAGAMSRSSSTATARPHPDQRLLCTVGRLRSSSRRRSNINDYNSSSVGAKQQVFPCMAEIVSTITEWIIKGVEELGG